MREAYHSRASRSVEGKSLRSAVSDYRQYVCPQVVYDVQEASHLIRLSRVIDIRGIEHKRHFLLERHLIESPFYSVPVIHAERVSGRIIRRCVEYYYQMLLIPDELLHLVIKVGNVEAAFLIEHLKMLYAAVQLSGDGLIRSPVPAVREYPVSRARVVGDSVSDGASASRCADNAYAALWFEASESSPQDSFFESRSPRNRCISRVLLSREAFHHLVDRFEHDKLSVIIIKRSYCSVYDICRSVFAYRVERLSACREHLILFRDLTPVVCRHAFDHSRPPRLPELYASHLLIDFQISEIKNYIC